LGGLIRLDSVRLDKVLLIGLGLALCTRDRGHLAVWMCEVATGSTGVRIQMIANEPAHECDTRARTTNGAQLLLHIEAIKGAFGNGYNRCGSVWCDTIQRARERPTKRPTERAKNTSNNGLVTELPTRRRERHRSYTRYRGYRSYGNGAQSAEAAAAAVAAVAAQQ